MKCEDENGWNIELWLQYLERVELFFGKKLLIGGRTIEQIRKDSVNKS